MQARRAFSVDFAVIKDEWAFNYIAQEELACRQTGEHREGAKGRKSRRGGGGGETGACARDCTGEGS